MSAADKAKARGARLKIRKKGRPAILRDYVGGGPNRTNGKTAKGTPVDTPVKVVSTAIKLSLVNGTTILYGDQVCLLAAQGGPVVVKPGMELYLGRTVEDGPRYVVQDANLLTSGETPVLWTLLIRGAAAT